MRLRAAGQELFDGKCQGRIAGAGPGGDEAQMPVLSGTPAQLRDALEFRQVHLAQPDQVPAGMPGLP